jgi:uncharacterized protein (TIGR02231 family)
MRTPRIKIFLPAALFLLFVPSFASAKPIAVELYPAGAKLTERTVTAVEQDGNRYVASFSIPIYADKDTLTIAPAADSNMTITSIQVELQTLQPTDKIIDLKNKLKDLLRQKADCESRIKANSAYISFWENAGKNLPEKTESVEKLAEAARKGIADANNDTFRINQAMEPLNNQIDEVKKQIDNLTGQAQKNWQVNAYLNKKGGNQIELTYSYYIGNCGWEPVYMLNAHPDQSDIEFAWYGDITQNTGLNWDNVDLTLATAQARPQPEPPQLSDWIIQPVQIYPIRRKEAVPLAAQAKANAPQDAAAEMEANAARQVEPERKEGYVFDTYDLGSQTIPAGETRRIDIRKKTWKTDFKYLIRPYEFPQAFVYAQPDFSDATNNEFVRLPQGMATFLIDSAVVSTRQFSLLDPETKLFFGADLQVSVKFDVLSKKSGEKWLFAGKKTYEWGWRVTVNNLKNHEISVLMEDAYPQLRDERIKLEENFSGITPEKNKNLLKWTFAVKPHTKTEIEYGFSITYPEDLNLTFGGR